MPPIQLLIKPASGLCNMRCQYCFYSDITEKRETRSYGIMSLETLEIIIKKALAYGVGSCTFAFQGGEPTLAGLDFFKAAVEFQKRHNVNQLRIDNAIQTNGYAIDEDWCRFLAENNFLTGLSLDGIKATHDVYRKSTAGEETFFTVLDTAKQLWEAGAEFNILTVVHGKTAVKTKKIYEFYRKNGFGYQQYIACMDPVFEQQGGYDYSLSPEQYGTFLSELFDLWYVDLKWGKQPYIRMFENYVGVLLGQLPESCEQRGLCSIQNVVEADGSVYPCDFYVLDEYRLGNLRDQSFQELEQRRRELQFLESSANHDESCRNCTYFPVCRGGCRRHRTVEMEGGGYRNYFCPGYKLFFEHSMKRLKEIAAAVSRGRT